MTFLNIVNLNFWVYFHVTGPTVSPTNLKSIIEKIPDTKKTFDEIKEFMGWKIKDDMIWDF